MGDDKRIPCGRCKALTKWWTPLLPWSAVCRHCFDNIKIWRNWRSA